MMKVGLITYSDSMNWGAQLQAYALRQAIEDKGVEAKQIDHRPLNTSMYNKGKSPIVIAKNVVAAMTKSDFQVRVRRTNAFRKRYLNMTHPCYDYASMERLNDEFDCFITGSDQVWNCTRGINDNFYLDFVRDNQKKCAYAASFGIAELPDQYRFEVARKLKSYRYISVRETVGKTILEKNCGREVDCVCDPVFLLTPQKWKNVINESSEIRGELKDRYIFVYATQITLEFAQLVRKVKNQYRLPVISTTWLPNCKVIKNLGPVEFVNCIQHAEIVVTTSFHATAFSVIFQKKFCVLPHKTTGNRVSDILNRLDLTSQIVLSSECGIINEPDYDSVREKLETYRQVSLQHLDQILDEEVYSPKCEKMNITEVRDLCTGCRVCEKICPKNCIRMEIDKEGFLYPIVEEKKCISCRLCLNRCHVFEKVYHENKDDMVYYGYSNNDDIRKSGSSGGAFGSIVEHIGQKQRPTWVFGSIYDISDGSIHQNGYAYPDYSALCQSKYVFSDPRNTFEQVKLKLNDGKYVIYCGTPCQIGALKQFLGKDFDKLLTLDFICHGVPAENFIRKHISFITEEKHPKVYFRSKAIGWGLHKHCLKIDASNGNQIYLMKAGKDFFFSHFLNNDCLRFSCYRCQYSKKHISDLTLGDFWEIARIDPEFDDGKGLSVVFANTDKGKVVLNELLASEEMLLKKCPSDYHRSRCGCDKQKLLVRRKFMYRYTNEDFNKLEKQFRYERSIILIKKILKKIRH